MKLEAGRELDALVAEKVMGWHRVNGRQVFHWDDADGKPCALDAFSTDIAAAWQIVEKFSKTDPHHSPAITSAFVADGVKGWCVSLGGIYSVFADTAPLAICLAALEAVGVENR